MPDKSAGSFKRNLPGPFPPLTHRGWSLVTAVALASLGVGTTVFVSNARGTIGLLLFLSAALGILFVYLALWREVMVRLLHALRRSALGETAKMAVFLAVLVAIPAVTMAVLLLIAS